jgi:hypothetical protein
MKRQPTLRPKRTKRKMPGLSPEAFNRKALALAWDIFGDRIGKCRVCGYPCLRGYVHCTPESGAYDA